MRRHLTPILAVLLALALGACSPNSTAEAPPKVAYVASRLREPFHRPTCTWARKIDPSNLQSFETREEADRRHRPCKVCRP